MNAPLGNYGFVQSSDEAAAIEKNLLEGTLVDTKIYAEAYVLGVVDGEVGLYKAELNQDGGTAFLNNANKAYLPMSAGMNSAAYSFRFPGSTGIENVDAENFAKAIYDLTGRKIENPARGIYIVNGNKVVIK